VKSKVNHEEAFENAVIALSSGQGENLVHANLVDSGFSNKDAETILQSALEHVRGKQDKEKKSQELLCKLIGIGLCAIGIGALVYSYMSARPGAMYVVPGGLIGYGFYMAATGDYRGPF